MNVLVIFIDINQFDYMGMRFMAWFVVMLLAVMFLFVVVRVIVCFFFLYGGEWQALDGPDIGNFSLNGLLQLGLRQMVLKFANGFAREPVLCFPILTFPNNSKGALSNDFSKAVPGDGESASASRASKK